MPSSVRWVAFTAAFLFVGTAQAAAQAGLLAAGCDSDDWTQAAGQQASLADDTLLASFALPAEMARFLAVGGGEAAACNAAYTCPSPKSCGSWSAPYDCDDPFCGGDSFCDAKGAPAWLQPTQKFRYCTLGNGSGCYEYSGLVSRRLHCGCI